jgi:sulfide:quinone oxidoreductase
MRVVIAGGGVAGLEAMLALHDLAEDRVEVELLSPAREFVYKPMLVAEPFGTARAVRLDLGPLVAAAGALHRADSLVGVDPSKRTVTTGGGDRLEYDALLVAIGAHPVEAVPGALTFDGESRSSKFEQLLQTLGSRHLRRLAFVVPVQPGWTIAAYELALMTAAERDARRIPELEITLITHEPAPLALFGVAASELVRETLDRARVGLRTSARAQRFTDSGLTLDGADESLAFDQVVAIPALEVPEVPGLPQRAHGFIGTDAAMSVDGLTSVWAAGDSTHFSVKQGGIAAQQADAAARAIAARAGAKVALEPFHPVLRAALITGDTPDFIEAELSKPAAGIATVGRPLWTPSIKLAAKYLSPQISLALRGGASPREFSDVEVSSVSSAPDADPRRAVEAALTAADDDAGRGDYAGALRWMSLIEQLDLAIPAVYISRRERWRRELDPGAVPHRAAGRIDPSFATPEEAISDLRRRIGWLREVESREGDEMAARLRRLEAGIDDVIRLSRRTGTLGY